MTTPVLREKAHQEHIFEGTTMTMRAATLALLVFVARVAGQPLKLIEHTAVMSFFTSLQCNDTIYCPRFAADDTCPARSSLACVGGSVTSMYVNLPISNSSHAVSSNLSSQNLDGSIGSEIGQLTGLTNL